MPRNSPAKRQLAMSIAWMCRTTLSPDCAKAACSGRSSGRTFDGPDHPDGRRKAMVRVGQRGVQEEEGGGNRGSHQPCRKGDSGLLGPSGTRECGNPPHHAAIHFESPGVHCRVCHDGNRSYPVQAASRHPRAWTLSCECLDHLRAELCCVYDWWHSNGAEDSRKVNRCCSAVILTLKTIRWS
jgi:hypothetical protein